MSTGTTLATMDQISSTADVYHVGTPPQRRPKRDAPASNEFAASPSSYRPGMTYQSHFRDGAMMPNGEPPFILPWEGKGEGSMVWNDDYRKDRVIAWNGKSSLRVP